MEHYQVTLTTANTVYNLKALVKAINASFQDIADQIVLQSDDGNSAAIFLGGSAVSTANYGIKLVAANDSFSRGGAAPGKATLADIYAVSGTNAQLLNISIFKG